MFKRFHIQVIFRVSFLVATILLLAWLLLESQFLFNKITVILIIVAQVAELIRFVTITNRELARLFMGIRHADFSINFYQSQRGRSFAELESSMMQILDSYKQVKIEKEAQYHFLQLLISQLPIGIITIADDELVLMNTSAEKMLDLEGLKNWHLITAIHPSLEHEINSVGHQGRKLIDFKKASGTVQLALEVNRAVILEKSYTLITVQDINTEMEQKELDAWHKLIRILTHEIMNSVTPITSLTETMQGMLSTSNGLPKKQAAVSDDIIHDIHFSLATIHKRSEGLLDFVNNYRKLTRVPPPKKEAVHLKTFLSSLVHLVEPELNREQIQHKVAVNPDTLTITIDPVLIEQVILNLVSNSIHALQGIADKMINVNVYPQDNAVVLEFRDNGCGVDEKSIKEIFIPFFSTKKEGSGIGLSLSKQIMSLHGGTIRVSSASAEGTMFVLTFNSN